MPGPMGGPMGPRGFLTDEEKQNVPKVSWKLIRRILSYLKPYWLQFLLVFLTILVSAGVGLLPSIITGRIVNEALVGKDMKLLVQLLIAAFLTLTVSQVIGVLESYINAWISNKIIYDMKNQMYGHLLSMPHAFFTTEKQGDIITRMNSDIGGVSNVISGTLTSIVRNIVVVVTTLVALFTMSWKLADAIGRQNALEAAFGKPGKERRNESARQRNAVRLRLASRQAVCTRKARAETV